MDHSQNLSLPYIMPQQAQKHITHNEALQMLDVIVQLSVVSDTETIPPNEPENGACYIIANGANGDWTGKEMQIAAFQSGAWIYYSPKPGWFVWVETSGTHATWNGTTWETLDLGSSGGNGGGGDVQTDALGVNANADTTNRLTVKSDSILFSQDDVTPGSGDIRTVLNKASSSNTAAFLFQDNYSGRAEIGLLGDNNFSFKTSADGSSFNDSIVIDAVANTVGIGTSQPQAPLHIKGDNACIAFENSQSAGTHWAIAPGKPGLYDDHLIIASGQNISNASDHRIRIPKNGAPEFVEGMRITDGETVASSSSHALAYYTPYNGSSRGEISFRGANDSGKAEFRLLGYYHNGGFNQVKAVTVLVNNSGPRLGVGVTSPKCALHLDGAARVGSYTVASLPSASSNGEGAIIYVSDEADGATLAFSDGSSWKRVSDNQTVS